jgi:hypothetical protein|tara:strand:- start:582 stop:764 length:183 start_codon:yes stop_codon:yes gene_type:complete
MIEKKLLLRYDLTQRIAYDLQRFDALRKDEGYEELSVQSLDRMTLNLSKLRANFLAGKYS